MRVFTINILLLFIATPFTMANYNKLTLIQSLKGTWAFSIGLSDEWISPKFDDSGWESIRVPAKWEDQGFNGYNGYAFYRKKVNINIENKGRMLYLYLGYIDDVDAAYFNGHKIGATGQFPPNFITAYNAERIYYIPEEYINFNGQNLIAVKVYDVQLEGGIVGGETGIYGGKTAIKFDVNLQTNWKFKTGDDLKQKDPAYDDASWQEIFVPAKWEDQGYRDYDGYAWYRKSFIFQGPSEERMVIVMGKIDDLDAVYINGTFVGSTGDLPPVAGKRVSSGQEYQAFRGYYIPIGLLKKGQKNTVAVRVLDTGGGGGIYEGPVGILTQTKYIDFWRKNKNMNH